MRKLKIAMLTANFPPYFGGIGNACYHNAIGLAMLGHKVTVFTRKYEKNFYYSPRIKVVQLRRLFGFGNAVFLPGLLRISGFDILHVHLPFHFGAEIALLVSKLRGIPMVVSYQMDLVGEGWLKHFFRVHEKTLLKAVLWSAKKIILSSRDFSEHSNFRKLFLERGKDVVFIPNGVDTEKFSAKTQKAARDAVRKKHGIRKAEKVILFVGALDKAHYFKGVGFLLKAFSRVHNNNVKLLIAGEGELKKKYCNEAEELGIADKVIFAGRVPEKELPQYYSLCDFLVLPSIDRGEAFGIVLVEAMASGKAVIASNLPGVRSIVEDKKNGLLFEPKNKDDLAGKINCLLSDKARCRKMGAAGRKKAEKEFDWRKIAKKISETYLQVKRVKA